MCHEHADVPDLTSTHLAAVDDLITGWHGQGPVCLPGGHRVTRRHATLDRHRADPPG